MYGDSAIPELLRQQRDTSLRDPGNPLSLYLRAEQCRENGDVSGWHESVACALALPHRTPVQLYCRGWAKLMLGDWSGWSDYEARLLGPRDASRERELFKWVQWTHERWDGRADLRDKALLVLPEQGLGDCVQMLRYVPQLADRARHVILMVYPRLVPLAQYNFGDRVSVVINGVDKPIEFDFYVRNMSLPYVTGTLPPSTPLKAPGRRPPLPARTARLRAGICWAGNADYGNDEARSIAFERMMPLLDRSDIQWYSLQVGDRASDADAAPRLARPWPPLITMADTADLLTELDVVVTVDTAVGHLAASLGVPTVVLLSNIADGRWGFGGRTPWYPTMQLLRQQVPGEWRDVIAEAVRALDQIVPRSTTALSEPSGHLTAADCALSVVG